MIKREMIQLLIDLMEKQRVLLIVHDYNTAADPDADWKKIPCDVLITTWNEWKNYGNEIRLREADINEYNAVAIFSHYYLSGSGTDLQDELRRYLTDKSESGHLGSCI